MCVLCGDLITQVHWTDQIHPGSDKSTVTVGDNVYRENTRTRLLRIQMVNRLLKFYGVSVENWNSTKYLIRDKKGNVKMATNLEEVWTFAEQLIQGEIDVLDPSFLSFVESQQLGGER